MRNEPAMSSGKVLKLVSGRTQVRLSASLHLSLQTLWFMDTDSRDRLCPAQLIRNIEMTHIAAGLNAETHFGGDSVAFDINNLLPRPLLYLLLGFGRAVPVFITKVA